MADFINVADETLTQITALHEHSEQTQSTLTESRDRLSQASDQLDSEWHEVMQHAQSILDQITSSQETLSGEHHTLTDVLTQLKSQLEELQTQINQDVEETQAAIANLNERAETLTSELDEAFQEAEEACNSLKEKTEEITSDLENCVSETETEVQENITPELQSYGSEIEQQTEQTETSLEECRTDVTTNVQESEQHFEEIEEAIATKLTEIGDLFRASLQENLDQLGYVTEDSVEITLKEMIDIQQMFEKDGETMKNLIDRNDDVFTLLNAGEQRAIFLLTLIVGIITDLLKVFNGKSDDPFAET